MHVHRLVVKWCFSVFLRAPEGRKRKIAILGVYSRKFLNMTYSKMTALLGGGWGKAPALRNARQIDSRRYGWVCGRGGKEIAIFGVT